VPPPNKKAKQNKQKSLNTEEQDWCFVHTYFLFKKA
jgi:hypothetical protein